MVKKNWFFTYLLVLVLLFVTNLAKADILLSEDFSSGAVPAGWTVTPLNGGVNWQVRNAPIFNSPSAGHYAVFDRFELGSGVSGTLHEAVLVTPSLDCSGRSSVHINFHHYWFGVESTNGYLEVSNNGGASWNIVATYESVTHGSLAAPEDVTFDLTAWAANESDVQVRFRYIDNQLLGRFWYIDDVTIYTDPDVGITNLILPDYLSCGSSYGSSETVTVEITNFGFFPVTNIPVECVVTGGTSATLTGTFAGTILPGQTASFTFSSTIDMSAEAIYDFNATTNLATDQYTANDSYYTSRQQLVQTYPYLADFNGTHAGWFATGQDPPLNNGRNFVHGEIPFLNGPQGEGDSWYVEAQGDVNHWIWVESPVFDLSGLTNPQLFLDLKHQLQWSQNVNRVEYSLNGGTNWVQLGSNSNPNWYNQTNGWRDSHSSPVDQWTTYQMNLCALIGESCVKFRVIGNPNWAAPSYPTSYLFAFDNFRIEDGPDVGVIAITEPDLLDCPSAFQQVTIEVYNYGCAAVSNVPVSCEVTGAVVATLTGTVPGPIPASSSVSYTFPSTFNMSVIGMYDFLAFTALPGDIAPTNDALSEQANVNNLMITTFPYTEDFNSGTGSWVASGASPPLNNGRNFIHGALPYLNGPQGQGDSWYVEANGNSGTQIWLQSPIFDFTNINQPVLSFDIKHSLRWNNANSFFVQYSLDGGNSWTLLGTSNDPNWYNDNNRWRDSWDNPVDQWTRVSYEMCEVSGESCVVFRIIGTAQWGSPTYPNDYLFAIDNVEIDDGTPPDVRPVHLHLTNAGSCSSYSSAETMAVIIENNSCLHLTNIPITMEFDGVVYSETVAGPISPNSHYHYTFNNSLNLSGAGVHEITVTTMFPGDSDPSNDQIIETRHNAIPINSYPYLADFNTGNMGWVSRTDNTTRRFELGELPYLNGPQGEGDSWYVEAQGDVSHWIWVESPVFDLSGLTNPQLFLDLKHQLQYSTNIFRVEYSLNGGTNWVQLGSNSNPNWYNQTNGWRDSHGSPVDQWTTYQMNLCALIGESCVKFRVIGNPRWAAPSYPTSYLFAFDNFRIEDGPDVGVIAITEPDLLDCPSAFQQVTIEVYNYGCAAVSNVPVSCEVTGAVAATLTGTVPGPIPASSSVSYTFPSTFNMSVIGMYDFLAFTALPGDIAPTNDALSEQANVNNLMITTFPYTEDFNSGTGSWVASGASPPLNNGRNFIHGALPYLNGPQGQGDSWYVEANGNSGTQIWLQSPIFDFTNINQPVLSFDIKHSLRWNNANSFFVQYSLDGGNSWTLLGTSNDPNWYNDNNRWRDSWDNPVDQWTRVSYEMCEVSGESCVVFRIIGTAQWGSPTYPNDYLFAIDNVEIDDGTPPDVRPVHLHLTNAGSCSSYSSAETMAVIIENNSCLHLTNIPITMEFDGVVYSETVAGPISPNSHYHYTFNNSLNLSGAGVHEITVTTMFPGDSDPSNDQIIETRHNAIPINSYPYLADFNTGNMGWVSRTDNTTRRFELGELPYLNGPQGEGDSWYVEAQGDVSHWIWVESPVFDLSGLTNPQLFLDLKHQLQYSTNIFRVEYSLNGGTNWVQLGSNSNPNWYNQTNGWRDSHGSPVDQWTTYQMNLCALIGESCVKFRVIGNPRWAAPSYPTSYLFAFDNFRIEDGPDVGVIAFHSPVDQGCLFGEEEEITIEVYNFGCAASNVPVVCEITGPSAIVLTEVISGSIPAGGSVLHTFSTTVDFTPIGVYNLTAYTEFASDVDLHNDTSYLTIEVNQPTIGSFPYYEDFNSGTGNWLIGGQNPPNFNNRTFVHGALPYLNGPQGQGDSWFVEATGNASNLIWVESPVFDFSNVSNPKLNMDIKHSLRWSQNIFRVEYTINGGSNWFTLGTNTDPFWYINTGNDWRESHSNPADQWTNVELPLCFLAGQACVKFRVIGNPHWAAPTYPNDYLFAFDNFHITDTPIDAKITFMYGCHGSEYGLDVTVFNNDRLCLTSPDITSIDLTYTIDGSTPVTQTFTGLNIPHGGSGVITIPGITIPSPTSEVTVWCSLPNGLVDQIFKNDTMRVVAGIWPDCNDHCSNATQLSIGTTSASQTSNATVTPGEEPAFACDGSITLENTVWFFFETGAGGAQDIEVIFENTACMPNISTAGIQVSINEITGLPCDPANYTEVFCDDPGNSDDIIWNAGVLPPNTMYYITIDGFAGSDCDFDITITGTGLTPLPVDLTSFTAVCDGLNREITWSTASEQNSHYFEVQRSLDGSNFEVIGTVNAAGNSNHHLSYSFTDEEKGLDGIIYYRLKQVDFDGKYRIYPAVSVVCASDEMLLQLYPNPTSTSSELYIYSEVPRSATLQLLNSEGRIVLTRALALNQGDNTVALDAASFAPGVYPIKISFGSENKHVKWVVVK
jgi:hypothetical protein